MGRIVGIDLGTTFSAVAVMNAAGEPEILPNRSGRRTTPSVVLFEERGGKDTPIVGDQAKRQAGERPDDVVQYVKRFMGDSSWRFDSEAGEEYRAEEVSAIILRALVNDAEAALGEKIERAVVTVPAYFDDARRVATQQAGALAGIDVVRVLNEPTAAALSYGLSAERDGNVLVYDLGGGTFDVTILSITGRTFTVAATDGDRNLGGFDWDNALMELVTVELEKQGARGFEDDDDAIAALRERAERAKRDLTDADATTIEVEHGGSTYRVDITRAQFEEATRKLLRRTQDLVEDTLDESGLDWDDLGVVLLVGGSTRMPGVSALMRELSGREPVAGVDPDEAVARGAAIQAALEDDRHAEPEQIAGTEVHDVTSQGLGSIAVDVDTVAPDGSGGELKNFILIPQNTPVPAQGDSEFQNRWPTSELHINITQGDDDDPEYITPVGEGAIQLGETWPAGTPYRLVFRYDRDQEVAVEVLRLDTGSHVGAFSIERVANLTEAEVEAAAERIRNLPSPEPSPYSAPPVPAIGKPLGAPIVKPEGVRIPTTTSAPGTAAE